MGVRGGGDHEDSLLHRQNPAAVGAGEGAAYDLPGPDLVALQNQGFPAVGAYQPIQGGQGDSHWAGEIRLRLLQLQALLQKGAGLLQAAELSSDLRQALLIQLPADGGGRLGGKQALRAVEHDLVDAMRRRLDHPMFGYFKPDERFYSSIIRWHRERYGVGDLKEANISYQHSVLGALSSAVEAFTVKGEGVLVQTPGYAKFREIIEMRGRRVVKNPLIWDGATYRLDFEDMERKIVEEKIRLAVFCSPHNPTGRVWTREELETYAEICLRHGVLMVSDEIWADFSRGEGLEGGRNLPDVAGFQRLRHDQQADHRRAGEGVWRGGGRRLRLRQCGRVHPFQYRLPPRDFGERRRSALPLCRF